MLSLNNDSRGPWCNTDGVTVDCPNDCMTCVYYIPISIVNNCTGLALTSQCDYNYSINIDSQTFRHLN